MEKYVINEIEWSLLIKELRKTNGNRKLFNECIHVDYRKTIWQKLQEIVLKLY